MGSLCGDDDMTRGGRNESLVHGLVDEGEQGVVVAINVQQAYLCSSNKSYIYVWMHVRVNGMKVHKGINGGLQACRGSLVEPRLWLRGVLPGFHSHL